MFFLINYYNIYYPTSGGSDGHDFCTETPPTVGDCLAIPAVIDMVKTVCGKDVARKLEIIPLLSDTVSRRIADLSLDIKAASGRSHEAQRNIAYS